MQIVHCLIYNTTHINVRYVELVCKQNTPDFAADYKWGSISLHTHMSVLDEHTKVSRVLIEIRQWSLCMEDDLKSFLLSLKENYPNLIFLKPSLVILNNNEIVGLTFGAL